MTIDLLKYVGETITAQLGDGRIKTGTVLKSSSKTYPCTFNSFSYTKDGTGYTQPNIVRIISVEQQFKGIAQKTPNINLDDFVGQKVYVKLDRGSEHITNVSSTYNLSEVGQYNKNGTSTSGNEHWDIVEIYGESAYEINTKSTFDNPNNYKIEQVKQLLNQMSEEEIAKLLKSLK